MPLELPRREAANVDVELVESTATVLLELDPELHLFLRYRQPTDLARRIDARTAPHTVRSSDRQLAVSDCGSGFLAKGMQWQDVDWIKRALRVERSVSAGRLGTPKAGHGRDVDLSQQTVEILRRLQV